MSIFFRQYHEYACILSIHRQLATQWWINGEVPILPLSRFLGDISLIFGGLWGVKWTYYSTLSKTLSFIFCAWGTEVTSRNTCLPVRIPHFPHSVLYRWCVSEQPASRFRALDYFRQRTRLNIEVLEAQGFLERVRLVFINVGENTYEKWASAPTWYRFQFGLFSRITIQGWIFNVPYSKTWVLHAPIP